MGGKPSTSTPADKRLKRNRASSAVRAKKLAAASPLPASVNEQRNTIAGRKKMRRSAFALPDQRKYRIDDPAHARDALARVAQFGSPAEKAQVRKAVTKRYPSIGSGD